MRTVKTGYLVPCIICGEMVVYNGGRKDRLCPDCHDEQERIYEATRRKHVNWRYAHFVGIIPGLPACWREIVDPFVGGMLEIHSFRESLPDLIFDGLVVEIRGKRLLCDGDKLIEYSGDMIGDVALMG